MLTPLATIPGAWMWSFFQLRNGSSEPCLVLLAGLEEEAVNPKACFYAESDKVGLNTPWEQLRMIRASPDLDYYDGE